ncbi:plakophilin-1 [Sphaeramia orbicularis]|uniref:Plakophilin 1 n=1 Tax=Sphaeramia orbicularis TaxID=375764 RepID=A0A673BG92_9TELE|nr:plakophilin-1 [Sphaeramia orbicularis]
MMAPVPLKSAMTISTAEDTSLALPSDNALSSGQARVLNQVKSIKRGKSKQLKSDSTSPSPTTPTSEVFVDSATFKFAPFKSNGTFIRNNTVASSRAKSQRSRTLSTKSIGGRHASSSAAWEYNVNTSNWPQSPNGLKPSRSDPTLAPPLSAAPTPALAPAPTMRAKGQSQNQSVQSQHTRITRNTYSLSNGQLTNSQTRMRPPSAQSNSESKVVVTKSTKIEQQSAVNSVLNIPDLTLKEAVEYLSHPEENFQHCGATYIQHATFKDESAKEEVFERGGIAPLVGLLRSPNPGVCQAAAGALRNLVFKNQNNKVEVQHCGGIAKALQLLKETTSTETHKQITGLLWNLSSADELKEELIATALPALTDNVVVPFTCWSDNTANNNIHPDVFYNATGCLRNLSSAQKKEREAMRNCNGLIDSIMSYVQSCVAEENPDDKSVENCACILHNLTYQLEAEANECFAKYYPEEETSKKATKTPTVGCFSPKSSKVKKAFALDEKMDTAPSGVKWLSDPKIMQTYLTLLGSAQKEGTLEACCGALQNLTASGNLGSNAISQILVQKLGVLQQIIPLLKSSNQNLQKAAVSLLGNLTRTTWLQPTMAKPMLPELASIFTSGPRAMGNSDETIATACNTLKGLMLADTESAKKVMNEELVTSLLDLSEESSYPKGSKAASLLAYSMWNDKNLQGHVKKLGYAKSEFINDNTIAAFKSIQIID